MAILSIVLCTGLLVVGLCSAQYYDDGRRYDDNYNTATQRTYVYNSRRYGRPQAGDANYDFNTRGRTDNDKFGYQGAYGPPTAVPLPGILAGWRPDIQGKERPNSKRLDRDVFVQTSYGQIQGFKVYLYDNPDPTSAYRPGQTVVEKQFTNVDVFLGIPYAQPPINEGRFRPPRPHRGWQVLQAVDFGPACPQPIRYIGNTKGIRDMDEDCLYLNIYSPTVAAGRPQLYPVMFYIHGGDFIHGASNQFPGHMLAGFYDVVVVTINYRLGALGFLSTGDQNSPGNYGILDQALALRWVYENIIAFNGDKDSITLFGPGAGAASAGLLALSPRSRDMVSKVIAQSGSALADWAVIIDKYRAQNTSRVFGIHMGCNIESSWRLIDCLKQARSAADLGNSELGINPPWVGMFPWAPVLDGNFTIPGDTWFEGWKEADWHFLYDTPANLIRRELFNRKLQYMAGVTTQEAADMIYENNTLAPEFTIDYNFFDQKVRELVLRYNYTLNPRGIYEAIKYMYTYWPDPNNTYFMREKYIDMMSDFIYRAPSDKIVKMLAEKNVPLYLYVTNTTVESLRLPLWRKVPHNIEYYFLTGAPFMDVEFFPRKPRLDRMMWTDNDRNMSHFFMKAYSNFARFGNPSQTQILGLHFEKAYNGQLKYLNINTTFNSSIMINYRQTESAFWTMYLPTVIGHLVPTYPPFTEYWWEPKEPLQIAFWSVSGACLLLIVLVVICCILWRNAKRLSDRYYSGDFVMREEGSDPNEGIENHSATNMYEFRDTPPAKQKRAHTPTGPSAQPIATHPNPTNTLETKRSASQATLRTGSNTSLKDVASNFSTSSPNSGPRKTPVVNQQRKPNKPQTLIGEGGVPQTQV